MREVNSEQHAATVTHGPEFIILTETSCTSLCSSVNHDTITDLDTQAQFRKSSIQ